MDVKQTLMKVDLDKNEVRLITKCEFGDIEVAKNKFGFLGLFRCKPEGEFASIDFIEDYISKNVTALGEKLFVGRTVDNDFITFLYYFNVDEVENVDDSFYENPIFDSEDIEVHFDLDVDWNGYENFINSPIKEIYKYFDIVVDNTLIWDDSDIDITEEIELMFLYYSVREEYANEFVAKMNNVNFNTNIKKVKALLVFSGYEIQASKTDVWTTQKILRTILDTVKIGEPIRVRFENIFAKL